MCDAGKYSPIPIVFHSLFCAYLIYRYKKNKHLLKGGEIFMAAKKTKKKVTKKPVKKTVKKTVKKAVKKTVKAKKPVAKKKAVKKVAKKK